LVVWRVDYTGDAFCSAVVAVIDRNNVFIVLLLMISVDIGVGTSLELHGDKFCYLGDMLSVDGNADATEVE